MGVDRQVARRKDKDLAKLLDRFVCVRSVQMYGVDASLFQFDTDLTFVAFALNADRTIYGRYGSRSQGAPNSSISTQGFKKMLEGALELHAKYPKGRDGLVKKTGPKKAWKTLEAIPDIAGKYKKDNTSTWGCIHCHTPYEAEVRTEWKAKRAIPDSLLWKYPSSKLLGFALDPNERATVTRVTRGSAADQAGLKAGDRIVALDGQTILSIADVDWALHRAPNSGKVDVKVGRGESLESLKIELVSGWRRAGKFIDLPRRLSLWLLQTTVTGAVCYDLDAKEKKKRGLSSNAMAIRVDSLAHPKSPGGWSRAMYKAGVKKGDVIVSMDGRTEGVRSSDFLAYVLQKKKPGETVKLKFLRGGKTLTGTLTLP